MLELREVGKTYSERALVALDRFSLMIEDGEIFSLVGPSGCGKTTLLKLIAGLEKPSTGTIEVDGRELLGLNSNAAMVFQTDAVFPWMTVGANILFGHASSDDGVVDHYLDLVGLPKCGDWWPRELSSGMRKRVELARAYASRAKILLLDEPFGSLDTLTKERLQQELLDSWQKDRRTLLFVTHDVEEAILLGHRVGVMASSPGRLEAVVDVCLPFPREANARLTQPFLDLRRTIMQTLRRRSLQPHYPTAVGS